MTRSQRAPRRGRCVGTCLLGVSLLALAGCSGEPEPEPIKVTSQAAPGETVKSALGKITLDAAAEGQDVLGVQISDDRGLVNLHYAGPADRYVTCESASWLVPGGSEIDVDLAKNAAFETIDDKGDPVSVERWVRLDALTNVVVSSEERRLQVQPNIRYIVSMVTEVYDLNQRIGHKAERLEFETGGSAITSTGHRCESTGAMEDLAASAAS
ncbi:MAG: hypothetical protein ACR2QJ_00705 [Geminicoccaceae bacterium]